MCAIVGSFDPKKILELIELNSYRGNFSWSVSGINSDYLIEVQEKGFGEFPYTMFKETSAVYNNLYWICHVQAPTGGLLKQENRIHPVEVGSTFLWHNGVLKGNWIEKEQEKIKKIEDFDTYLIARRLRNRFNEKIDYSKVLDDIDGSFACAELVVGDYFRIFRNDASPLFVNGTDISSVKFDEAEAIEPDVVYDIRLEEKDIVPLSEFKNKTKPFFFI